MSKLTDLAKQINKDFGSNVVTLGAKQYDSTRIPFTSSRANYCLYGGVPTDKAVEFFGPEHSGKAQPLYSKVMTPNGFVTIGSVKVGDDISGDDGKVYKCVGIFPQGLKDVYELTFNDHTKVRCSKEHLWNIQTAQRRWDRTPYRTLSLEDIIKIPLTIGIEKPSHNISIPINNPIEFYSLNNLKIDPYLLGIILGDGCLSNNTVCISLYEEDVRKIIKDILEKDNFTLHSASKNHPEIHDYRIFDENPLPNTGKKGVFKHRMVSELSKLGLIGKHSYDKHIPKEYLFSSIENRKNLLAGILDSDGYVKSPGITCIYTTSSPYLSVDVAFLARSLGCVVTTSYEKETYYTYKGENRIGRECFTLKIKMPLGYVVYKSKKNLANCGGAKTFASHLIYTIQYIGKEECVCISTNNPSKLYITDDFIVTHNTTSALDIVANAQIIESENHLNKIHEVKDLVSSLTESGGKKLDVAQKELDSLLDIGPRKCVYVDAENTLDTKWAEKLGVDVDNMILIQPQEQSAEQVLQMILDVIDTGEAAVVVLDSVAMLVPQNILEEGMDKKSYCGVAGPMTVFCAKISGTGRLTKNNTLLILINQIREDISNPYNAYNSPGGKALKHTAAIRMLFRHGSFLDENNNELAMKNAGTPAGNKVDFTIVKTKCCKPDRRLGFYTLKYNTGIDYVSDLIDLGIKYDLVQKGGAWFELPNGEKLQGIKAVRLYYEDHFAEYNELEEQIKEIMANEQ